RADAGRAQARPLRPVELVGLDGEQVLEHEPQHEHRDGRGRGGDDRGYAVAPGVAPDGGQQADRDPDDDLDDDRPDRQPDAVDGAITEDLVDAAAVQVGLAEVPLDRALPVVAELDEHRVVEPVALLDALEHALVDVPLGAAGDEARRVAREEEEEEEQERERDEDRRDDEQQAADDVARHGDPRDGPEPVGGAAAPPTVGSQQGGRQPFRATVSHSMCRSGYCTRLAMSSLYTY